MVLVKRNGCCGMSLMLFYSVLILVLCMLVLLMWMELFEMLNRCGMSDMSVVLFDFVELMIVIVLFGCVVKLMLLSIGELVLG